MGLLCIFFFKCFKCYPPPSQRSTQTCTYSGFCAGLPRFSLVELQNIETLPLDAFFCFRFLNVLASNSFRRHDPTSKCPMSVDISPVPPINALRAKLRYKTLTEGVRTRDQMSSGSPDKLCSCAGLCGADTWNCRDFSPTQRLNQNISCPCHQIVPGIIG